VALAPPVLSADLEDHFDLDGNIHRQRCHADRAASTDAVFRSKDFREQVAESVDDSRMVLEVGGGEV